MRRLILVVLVVLCGLLPSAGFAQAPAVPPAASHGTPGAPATTPPAAAAATGPHLDETSRVLAIGLGAITGMVVLSVASANMISSSALANLGQGALVFIGTVVGGLTGNWLFIRDAH